jgi:putative nucleotidyltransferase with HDIG domain
MFPAGRCNIMTDINKERNSAMQEIKSKLRQVAYINSLVVYIMLAIVAFSVYEPLGGVLDFLPEISISLILLIVMILTLSGMIFLRVLTKRITDNLLLYERQLGSVLQFSKDIREEVHSDVVLEMIADTAMELTSSSAVSVLMVEGEKLVFKIAKADTDLKDVRGKSVPLDTCVAGWVVEDSNPLYIEDIGKSDIFSSSLDCVTDFKAVSVLGVPLITRRGVIGVVELLNKDGGPYDDKDLEIAANLASQAASAIEKAGFFEDQRNYEVHVTEMLIEAIDHMNTRERGHSKNVARYSTILARALQMEEKEQKRIYYAGLLHDIGYLNALRGNGSAAATEREHARIGAEMLKNINFYSDLAGIVMHHHERFDGSGTPGGLQGGAIPLGSRIIAVAEAFDRIMGDIENPDAGKYESAFSELQAIAGTELDPPLVDEFVDAARETLVQ